MVRIKAMTYHIVETPGNGTRNDGSPNIAISGGGETPTNVTVTYFIPRETPEAAPQYAEITFLDVLELRWIEWDVAYETHAQHEDDYEFGLIEIVDSAYLAAMPRSRADGTARHFRLGVDDWGDLNVIALDVRVRSIGKPSEPLAPGGEA